MERVHAAHRPVCLNDPFEGQRALQTLRVGLCGTPTDAVTPVAPILAAFQGLPAKTGVGSDGLGPGKESLKSLATFQGSSAPASDVGTGHVLPGSGPVAHTRLLGPPTLLSRSHWRTAPCVVSCVRWVLSFGPTEARGSFPQQDSHLHLPTSPPTPTRLSPAQPTFSKGISSSAAVLGFRSALWRTLP